MSNPENLHPSFDQEEQQILQEIVGEDSASVNEQPDGQPEPTNEAKPNDANPETPATEAKSPETPAQPVSEAAPAPTQTTAHEPAPSTTTQTEGDQAAKANDTPAQPSATDKPQGDTRAALRAARASEKRLRNELEETRRELEALRTGKEQVNADISDEELDVLEQDNPVLAKLARQNKALQEQLQQLTTTNRSTPDADSGFTPIEYPTEVQEVIDQVPELLNWQFDPGAQDKFKRAIDYDRALAVDPDWKDKPVAERFAEAAKRTRQAFGMDSQTTASPSSQAAAPAAQKPNQPPQPKPSLEKLPVEGPKGISDFKGGAPATAPELDFTRMSDEDILAALPVQG